ncbi:MAG: GGDEF domain-containing protein, partial [Spirochaetes bacterium]|nr:GGDEF domain-containing protein [Spirochaetota bacterium]
EHLRDLAVTDDLTGLFNRRGFALAAEQEIKHAFRRKVGLVLLFLDIDNLKIINDTFGHAEGDKAIKKAAKALRTTFRESDVVARWGGDEFVVLALDVPKGRVPILINRLDDVLHKSNEKQDIAYHILFSKGFAYFDPAKPLTLSEMVKVADEMMYKDKQERNLSIKAAFDKLLGNIEA